MQRPIRLNVLVGLSMEWIHPRIAYVVSDITNLLNLFVAFYYGSAARPKMWYKKAIHILLDSF